MPRLSAKNIVDIVNAYTIDLTPAATLAAQYGMTRQGILKALQRSGIDTSKQRIEVTCDCCGKVHTRAKCQIRRRTHMFCSHECYSAFLAAGNGNPYRVSDAGRKIARQIVERYHHLEPGHIVHHEDRNQYNNTIENLMVFATPGDHIRYHRGLDILPIWSGKQAKVKTAECKHIDIVMKHLGKVRM